MNSLRIIGGFLGFVRIGVFDDTMGNFPVQGRIGVGDKKELIVPAIVKGCQVRDYALNRKSRKSGIFYSAIILVVSLT